MWWISDGSFILQFWVRAQYANLTMSLSEVRMLGHCSAWFGSAWPDLDWLRMWEQRRNRGSVKADSHYCARVRECVHTPYCLWLCVHGYPCVSLCRYTFATLCSLYMCVCAYVFWPVFHCVADWNPLQGSKNILLPWREGRATLSALWWNRTKAEKQGTYCSRSSREFTSAEHKMKISLWEKQHQCLPGNLKPWMSTNNGCGSSAAVCGNVVSSSVLWCFDRQQFSGKTHNMSAFGGSGSPGSLKQSQ